MATSPLVKGSSDQEVLKRVFCERAEVERGIRGPVEVKGAEEFHDEEVPVIRDAGREAEDTGTSIT